MSKVECRHMLLLVILVTLAPLKMEGSNVKICNFMPATGNKYHLGFKWYSNCSSDNIAARLIVYQGDEAHCKLSLSPAIDDFDVIEQQYYIDELPPGNDKIFRFEWPLQIEYSTTCCWSVTNVKIVQLLQGNPQTSTAIPIDICYKDKLLSQTNMLCFNKNDSETTQIESNTYRRSGAGKYADIPCSNVSVDVSSSSNNTMKPLSSLNTELSASIMILSLTNTTTPSSTSTTTPSSTSTITPSSTSTMTSSTSIGKSSSTGTMTPSSTSTMTPSTSTMTSSSSTSTMTPSSSTMTSPSSTSTMTPSSSTMTSPSSTSTMTSPSSTSTMTSSSSRNSSSTSTMTSSLFSDTPQSSSLPSKTCSANDPWPLTLAGTNVTLSSGIKECGFNGSVKAIRFCDLNGDWGEISCLISPQFIDTLNEIILSPVDGLSTLSSVSTEVSLTEFVFLIDTALDIVLESPENVSNEVFIETFLNVSEVLISSSFMRTDAQTGNAAGSQLLLTLDNFALNFLEPPTEILLDELFLNVTSVVKTSQLEILAIDIDNNSITLPGEIFTENNVHVASFLFPDLSNLLPPVNTDNTIISPVLSSTIDCRSCPISTLTKNVTITLTMLEESVDLTTHEISCVFYDFTIREGLLPTGDWNTRGCTTITNGSLVTCSCNHLTHFAILLSPRAAKISSIHHDVLNTIGLVLVPISLLCMVMVMLTFTLIRSLWSIRNYIHIMLCVSLFMAQLVFMIGIDKIQYRHICSAVTVLLVYLFLVSFMWMLMEGVVLYVTLIRVFIHNHKYYVIAFTVSSYVLPALYMAIIVPIGYVVNVNNITDHTHFLYYNPNDATSLSACWLNYSTGFIWSFIAPVIAIILVNIGFFIMAIVVMRKHTKKQQKSTKTEISHWLKASISLTLVMGIAWIAGLLGFKRELLPVIYIITIFIAAQGILLFIILVVLSKQVRDAYYKVWVTRRSQSAFLTKLSDFTSQSLLSGSLRPNSLNSNKEKSVSNGGHVGGIVLGTFEEPTSTYNKDSMKRDLLQGSNSHYMESPVDAEAMYSVDTGSHGDDTVVSNSHVYEDPTMTDTSQSNNDQAIHGKQQKEPIYSNI